MTQPSIQAHHLLKAEQSARYAAVYARRAADHLARAQLADHADLKQAAADLYEAAEQVEAQVHAAKPDKPPSRA